MNGVFFFCGIVAIVFVLFISVYLIISGLPAIAEIGLVDFLFGQTWASTAKDPQFGILPFILTSIYGTAGAMVLGVPVGLMTAVFSGQGGAPRAGRRGPARRGPAGRYPLGGVRPHRYDGAGPRRARGLQPARRRQPVLPPSSCWPS